MIMRMKFAPLDDALIERLFQPASDMVTNRLGGSPKTVACFCVDIASVCWIVSRLPGLSDAVVNWDASASLLNLSLLLLGLVAMISLQTLFRRAGGKQANPLRQAMRPHRGIVLLMLAARLAQLREPGLADAADLAMLMFAAFALYLGACTERPPVRRRWAALVPAGSS
jgi:hypothetical protein